MLESERAGKQEPGFGSALGRRALSAIVERRSPAEATLVDAEVGDLAERLLPPLHLRLGAPGCVERTCGSAVVPERLGRYRPLDSQFGRGRRAPERCRAASKLAEAAAVSPSEARTRLRAAPTSPIVRHDWLTALSPESPQAARPRSATTSRVDAAALIHRMPGPYPSSTPPNAAHGGPPSTRPASRERAMSLRCQAWRPPASGTQMPPHGPSSRRASAPPPIPPRDRPAHRP